MAKLSFKVYLVNEEPWTEVRRFGVDADVATNFVYLREKLQTIFPDLRGKSFTVTWKGEFLCDSPVFFSLSRLGERSSELTSAVGVVYRRSRVTFCAVRYLPRPLTASRIRNLCSNAHVFSFLFSFAARK